MSSVRVLPNQTLFDLAVRHLGSAETVFELARLNGLNVTTALTTGQLINLPEVTDPRVVRDFVTAEIQPAANLDTGYEAPQGIGFWVIGSTFVVS